MPGTRPGTTRIFQTDGALRKEQKELIRLLLRLCCWCRRRRSRGFGLHALDLGVGAQLGDHFGLAPARQVTLDLVLDLVILGHRAVSPILDLDDVPAELR